MSEDRVLPYGSQLPPSWLAALQEFISTAAVNFHLTLADQRTVQVVANSGNGQVAIGIQGLWRYITGTKTGVISGSAGLYDIFVVCGPNNFVVNSSPPPPELDETNYDFDLQVLAHGSTPAITTSVTNYRKVGDLDWDGTTITGFRPRAGDFDPAQPLTATSPTKDIVAARAIAAAAQVAPIATWESSTGTVLVSVGPTGQMVFTVSPTAPTPSLSDDSTKVATTAFVWNALASQAVSIATGAGGGAPGWAVLSGLAGSGWDGSASYTVAATGYYHVDVMAFVTFGAPNALNNPQTIAVGIAVNGETVPSRGSPYRTVRGVQDGDQDGVIYSRVIHFTAGDTFKVMLYNGSTVGVNAPHPVQVYAEASLVQVA